MNNKIILTLVALISSLYCDAKEIISSPNGLIEAIFEIVDGKPVYSLQYKGKEVIKPSCLGFDIKGKPSLMGSSLNHLIEIVSMKLGTWFGVRKNR